MLCDDPQDAIGRIEELDIPKSSAVASITDARNSEINALFANRRIGVGFDPMPAFRSVSVRSHKIMSSQTRTYKLLALKNGFRGGQQFTCSIRLHGVAACTRTQNFFCDVSRSVFAYKQNFGRGRNF
jgi:hypothetical protein